MIPAYVILSPRSQAKIAADAMDALKKLAGRVFQSYHDKKNLLTLWCMYRVASFLYVTRSNTLPTELKSGSVTSKTSAAMASTS